MKKYLSLILIFTVAFAMVSCGGDEPVKTDKPETEKPTEPETPGGSYKPDEPGKPDEPSGNGKILVAYFSWGGTTLRMAQQISQQTGATLFEIEPVTPYPSAYTPTTEVALQEKNSNARPAIKAKVENWNDYDTVFIGCPVWWWTTPMIIHTFTESYDFKGKTVVPFCTYAATYRDETLAEIVNITPDAKHLQGLGLTSGEISQSRIKTWLSDIKIFK